MSDWRFGLLVGGVITLVFLAAQILTQLQAIRRAVDRLVSRDSDRF